MDLAQLVFYFCAGLAVVSSILMITRKNPVYSAMFLVVTLFAVAAIYVLQGAHFLGALQVIVYAGAIMVLFLFVIMLLNLGHDFEPDVRGKLAWVFAGGLGLVMFAEILTALRTGFDTLRAEKTAAVVDREKVAQEAIEWRQRRYEREPEL